MNAPYCAECDTKLIDWEVLVCPCCGLEDPCRDYMDYEPDTDWPDEWMDDLIIPLSDYEKRLNRDDY